MAEITSGGDLTPAFTARDLKGDEMPAMWRRLVEGRDGVHLQIDEMTLCGESAEHDENGEMVRTFKPARKATVTCTKCATIILTCRGVRVAT